MILMQNPIVTKNKGMANAGSIEVGKFADFVLLDKDLMTIDAKEILSAKVLMTFVDGELVYQK